MRIKLPSVCLIKDRQKNYLC